mgnify:CR=1 FL=1
MAGRLIDELEKRGVRVPEDCSVVGFDNYLWPGLPDRGITTYEVDMKAMAQAALGKMLARLEGSDGAGRMELVSGHIVEKARGCHIPSLLCVPQHHLPGPLGHQVIALQRHGHRVPGQPQILCNALNRNLCHFLTPYAIPRPLSPQPLPDPGGGGDPGG